MKTTRGTTARKLRTQASLSLREAARRAQVAGHDLSYATLSRLERGEQVWTERLEHAVAAGLGVTVAELLGEDLLDLSELTDAQRAELQARHRAMLDDDEGDTPAAEAHVS